ncbi:hypothetical protein FHS70_005321 [Flammeovirga yaeyamensis]|nr:hypothetical protein [Flammeovirga yaeyamensis]
MFEGVSDSKLGIKINYFIFYMREVKKLFNYLQKMDQNH